MVVLDGGKLIAKGQYSEIKDSLNMIGKDFVSMNQDDNAL
jgi:hypothetical protein